MNRLAALVLMSLLVASSADARPKIQERSFHHGTGERTYHLYAPKSLGETGAPLLLTFHGSGRNGASLVEKWTKLADRNGFIVKSSHQIRATSSTLSDVTTDETSVRQRARVSARPTPRRSGLGKTQRLLTVCQA